MPVYRRVQDQTDVDEATLGSSRAFRQTDAAGFYGVQHALDVRDFADVYGGVTDGTDALQDAFDQLVSNQGGELIISGKLRIEGEVAANFLNAANDIVIRGLGCQSQIIIAGGTGQTAIQLTNANSIRFENLFFVGVPGPGSGPTDCDTALAVQSVRQVQLSNCHFFGIKSNTVGKHVVLLDGDARVMDCSFRGSTSGFAAVLGQDGSDGLTVLRTDFLDYGNLNGVVHNKLGLQCQQWISVLALADKTIGTGANKSGANQQRQIEIIGCRFDEGAKRHVAIWPTIATGLGRCQHVRIEGCQSNVSVGGSMAYNVRKTDRVLIKDCWIGYNESDETNSALTLEDVEYALLEGIMANTSPTADRFIFDSSCGHVIVRNCRYNSISYNPATTLDIETPTSYTLQRATTFNDLRAPLPATAGYIPTVADAGTGRAEWKAKYAGIPSTLRDKLVAAWSFEEDVNVAKTDRVGILEGSATPVTLTHPAASPTRVAGRFGFASQFARASSQSLAASTSLNSDPRLQMSLTDWFAFVVFKFRVGSLATTANTHALMCKYSGSGAFEYYFQKSNQSPFRMRFIANGIIAQDPWDPVEDLWTLGLMRWKASTSMLGIKMLPSNGGYANAQAKAWTETSLVAGPLQSTGRFAFGQQGSNATNFADVIIDEAAIGHGLLTDQEENDLWDLARLNGWPYEVQVGRTVTGESEVFTGPATSLVRRVPEYDPSGNLLGYRYLYSA
jgi:hypothetical protein